MSGYRRIWIWRVTIFVEFFYDVCLVVVEFGYDVCLIVVEFGYCMCLVVVVM